MFEFKHLNTYAAFLLENQIDGLTKDLIALSYEVNVPLLQYLKHLSQEELFNLSKISTIEFLTAISNNKAKEFIQTSTERWLSDQLDIIGKFDVEAEDITLVSYVRSRALKKHVISYTTDLELVLKLYNEIDDFFLGSNTTSTQAFIKILKDKIQQEEHFSTNIISSSPGIIFIYDLVEQKEVYITGKVEETTGFTPEEVLQIPNLIAQLTHPEDVAVVSEFLHKVVEDEEGRTQHADYRFRNKEGNYFWFRCYASVYKRDASGQPVQILGTAYEITKEKEIAQRLEKRERQLLEAQTIGKIGSYEWDVINDTSVSTPEVDKIFELKDRQPLQRFFKYVHQDDKEKVEKALSEAFATGRYSCEYRYITETGEKVIDSKGIVHYNTEQKPAIMIGTVQDVTDRKRIEENLRKNTLELEKSNALLEEFAYVASHDLKEPLRKIAIFANIIITTAWDEMSERTKVNIQKISSAANSMQHLIEGILTFSLINNQQSKEWCNLEEILQQALYNLEFKIEDTNASIQSDGLTLAAVVPFQIQRLFQNLISNAIKFSKKNEQPQIKITHSIVGPEEVKNHTVDRSGNYLKIEVADNGIGFSDELSEKVFGLFKRLYSKTEYEGSGLGLAICRRVAENHGGVIYASSQPGQGSTFTIILPHQTIVD